MTDFPIQLSKVQPPPLRDATLARDRLLDWLHAKAHRRVILLIAEAGYGKTTLLADFTRRTRLRVIWYRLDSDDRDWTVMLRHLVVAGRELLPGFAPATESLLAEIGLGPTGPGPDAVIEAFIRELAAFGREGAVLILDDLHLVEDVPEIQRIVRGLISRAPDRISVVLASRRMPNLPLARLRSHGEVASLTTDDLRFSEEETGRLFAEAYGRPLEPDVLEDLARRTEGWAASLTLVETAIRDRTQAEVRTFIRQLSGASGDLHDYLAEEVLSDLTVDARMFLMRTSLLQSIDPELAVVAAGVTAIEARDHLVAAERLGLLHRRGRSPTHQFHPLVREFLERRLVDECGLDVARQIHLEIAAATAANWRVAAHHLAAAGATAELEALIDGALATIAGLGEYTLANEYLSAMVETPGSASAWVIRSRAEYWRGHMADALDAAERAATADPKSDLVILNLTAVRVMSGDMTTALEIARRLVETVTSPDAAEISQAIVQLALASQDGSIPDVLLRLEQLEEEHERRGYTHFAGISSLNMAEAARVLGDIERVKRYAQRALEFLEASSAGPEMLTPRIDLAWSAAAVGDYAESRALQDASTDLSNPFMRGEALRESALVEIWFGSAERASRLLGEIVRATEDRTVELYTLADVELALREGRAKDALDLAASVTTDGVSVELASKSRRLALQAHAAVATGQHNAGALARQALGHAISQEATIWVAYSRVLAALAEDHLAEIGRGLRQAPMVANPLAGLLVRVLSDVDAEALNTVQDQARRLPERWRPALRSVLESAAGRHEIAAQILAEIGTADDVVLLRRWTRTTPRSHGKGDLARALARRVAPRAVVHDLGKVNVWIGPRSIEGSAIRRKVLSLLCFLLSRPQFASTRDQVIDALWPRLDPDTAINSLHQTVYFLRRVFEPNYKEELSPGYLQFSNELIWLDRELMTSVSAGCWTLIGRATAAVPELEDVLELSDKYSGQFALEFTYDEWASSYRDRLHASYLQVVEEEVRRSMSSGHFQRGVLLARRALEVDQEAEGIELSLIRLYRLSGAHAAAAEQYAHYAESTRELLGVDPPPLAEL